MINKVFAQNFVRKMEHTMNLKVNVMDERGVIIASASKERVGDFHLIAYEIIQKGLPMLITHQPTKELIGVNSPGVNYRLTSSNETIGVIGVSGDPDEVGELAKLVKLIFETMYEYEYKKNIAMKGQSGIWSFAHALLNETPINEYSIKKIASKLGIENNIPRLPIYIYIHSEYRSTVIQHFLDTAGTLRCQHTHDVVLPVDKGILYLRAASRANAVDELLYRENIEDFIRSLDNEFFARERTGADTINYHVLIATVQTDFVYCHRIYENLLWLAAKLRQAPTNELIWENDYLHELVAAQLTQEFSDPLFVWYRDHILKSMEYDIFMDTVCALFECDMKLEQTALKLHLHKNSVIARLKKIKDILLINPIASQHDAAFLHYLYIYMMQYPPKRY